MTTHMAVAFTHRGKTYQLGVKHYKRKGISIFRCSWYNSDRWNGMDRFPRSVQLSCIENANGLFIKEVGKEFYSPDFIQAMGEAVYEYCKTSNSNTKS